MTKCTARVPSKTGKRFGGSYQCSRNAVVGYDVCRQHGAKTHNEVHDDYLAVLAEKKGEELRAAQAKTASAASERYKVAEEKATRLTRMAPKMLAMLERVQTTDALRNEEEELYDEVSRLIKEAKGL